MCVYISVIIPCYNGESFIAEAIESIKIQDRKDVELIIVDDGSTDNTAEVCKEYENSLIRYIHTDNQGAGHARNQGIDYARGTWIMFLDADDLFTYQSINNQFIENLREYERKKTDLICTPYILTDMALTSINRCCLPQNPEQIEHHMYKNAFWTCIYRKSFLKEKNVRFYEYRKQDVETAFRYKVFSAAQRIEANNAMWFYIQRDNLCSNTHTWNHYHLYHIKAKIYFDLYQNTAIKEDEEFLLSICAEMLKSYFKLCIRHGYPEKDIHKEMYLLLSQITSLLKDKKLTLMKKMWILTTIKKAKIKGKQERKLNYSANAEITIKRLKELKFNFTARK